MGKAIFVQDGLAIDYTPTANVAHGTVVDLGDTIGVTKRDIAAGALGAVAVEGIFDFAKTAGAAAFSVGDVAHWDMTNGLASRTGGPGFLLIGTVVAAALAADTSVRVRLQPHAIPGPLQGMRFEDIDLSAGSKTLNAQDIGKVLNVVAGHATNVITLPATASGLVFAIRCGRSGDRVAVSPQAVDLIFGPGFGGVDNKDRILAAATSRSGDYTVLAADAINGWALRAERGLWANEP